MASDVTVTARVDRNQMRPGDTFTYSVSVASEGGVDVDRPQLPDLSGFELLNSWSGSEMRGTFVNGQVKTMRSLTFNFMLTATRSGQFTIGASEVVVNGQAIRSNPITIEVSENAPQGTQQRQQDEPDSQSLLDQMDQMEEDLFSQLLNRRLRGRGQAQHPGSVAPQDLKDAFFIEVETDKTRVYQGESIVASWYLVTRAQIADIDTLKYPALKGFWKEDIEIATRLNFQPVVINGIQYQKALLASYALFPIKPGVSEIDPYQARCRVVGHNLLGMPQDAQITKQSRTIKIDVLPVPTNSSGDNYSGGVGLFDVSAKAEPLKLKANTPVAVKVRIEGVGNAKFVEMPKFSVDSSAQVYETKSEMKFFANGRSYKEFETLIVPRNAGEFKVPPISFLFFNPNTKSYYKKSTDEILLQVEAGDASSAISSTTLEKINDLPTEKKGVLPGIIAQNDKHDPVSLRASVAAWSGLYIVSILGLALYAYQLLRTRGTREDLKKRIQKKMAILYGGAAQSDFRKVGVEATNLIYSVLGEISGIGGAAFELDRLIESSPPSFKKDIAPKIKTVMAKLEIIGFAPESAIGDLKESSQLKKIVNEVEVLLAQSSKYDFSTKEHALD